MIRAPEGRLFISPDLPQADARIVAWDAECLSMIKVFQDPTRHIHLENCERLFSKPITTWSKEQIKEYKEGEEYKHGKAMLHAANYRMAAKRLAVELRVEIAVAKKLLAKYFSLYPEIQTWHNCILQRIRTGGFLETPAPFRRRRLFYTAMAEYLNTGEVSNESWNSACSWIPQSAVADVVNWGMRRLKDKYGDRVWLHKHDHDSYLASIEEQDQEEIIPDAIEMLKVEMILHHRPLVMTPDMSLGWNYGLLVGWKGSRLDKEDWWNQVKDKLSEERLRKEVYGYV